MEKKCSNCKNMTICVGYKAIADCAYQLNLMMRENPIGESGYTVMINTLAHNCKWLVKFTEVQS